MVSVFLCLIVLCGVMGRGISGAQAFHEVTEEVEPLTGYKWWGGFVLPALIGALVGGAFMLRRRKRG